MPIIEVDHVSKEFQLGELESFKSALRNQWRRLRGQPPAHQPMFKALDDVNFNVEPGEVLGIIGHNGAGKSTLLKLLAGISKPSDGRITTRGRIAPLIEVGAGFVGQLTGRENVYLNGAILGMSKKEIDRKFDEIVDFSELEEFIDTPVKRYSSGMRVKLAFSVATSIDAEILILDEVLAVGDLAFQRKSFDRMEAMIKRDRRTVLLVSHNIRQVERLCDRVIELSHGRIAVDGDPTTVCNHFVEANNLLIKQAQLKQGARAERVSTGVELTSLELLNSEGHVTDSIRCLAQCSVRMKFTTKIPIPKTTFCIGIHTTDFFYLTADNTAYDPRDCEPGTYVVQLDVRSMTLLPGVYCLLVWIGSDIGETYYSAENIQQFTVTANDYKLTRQRDRAVVKLESSWKLVTPEQAVEVVAG